MNLSSIHSFFSDGDSGSSLCTRMSVGQSSDWWFGPLQAMHPGECLLFPGLYADELYEFVLGPA